MANFAVTYSFVANTKARSAEVNQNNTEILNILKAHHHDPNLYTNASPITNSGIAANAQILDTQLKSPFTRIGLISQPGVITAAAVAGLINIKFGGNGADGALSISSGTTTLSAASAVVLVKNYTSISITGTASLAFSDPHANGTTVILRSMTTTAITSSGNSIDLRGMGAAGGTGDVSSGSSANGILFSADTPRGVYGNQPGSGNGGPGGGAYSNPEFYTTSANQLHRRVIYITPGSGGGGGANGFNVNGGAGGRGGGAMLLESAGALNFTGTINSSGSNGTNGQDAGARSGAGGGGGGSAGMVVVLANSITASSGTITATGGNGGDGGDEAGFATSATGGGGGGGAGMLGNAGGTGGNSQAGGGSPSAGAGGGGGGGGSSDGSAANGGGAGGTGGSSIGGVVAENIYYT